MCLNTRLNSRPLLIVSYINDIVFVCDVANVIVFAGDTKLFFSGSNFNYMSALINQWHPFKLLYLDETSEESAQCVLT